MVEETHVGEGQSNVVIVARINDHSVIGRASWGSDELHTTLRMETRARFVQRQDTAII